MKKECKHKILEYTNQYADSYKCVKCGRIFVVSHSFRLIKEADFFNLLSEKVLLEKIKEE